MSHIVESCALTKLNGGLSRLYSADEDAVSWLTSYGSWNAYKKKKISSIALILLILFYHNTLELCFYTVSSHSINGTEEPYLCWCAVKKLLTHSHPQAHICTIVSKIGATVVNSGDSCCMLAFRRNLFFDIVSLQNINQCQPLDLTYWSKHVLML